jgi:hypothetical protein
LDLADEKLCISAAGESELAGYVGSLKRLKAGVMLVELLPME